MTEKPDIPERRNVGGRPRKLAADDKTLAQLRGMSTIMCTAKEGAAVMGVTEKTFLAFLADYPEARAAWDDGRGQGKMSLRRKQWALADKNAAMAIFLGKNYLGQADQTNVQHSGSLNLDVHAWLTGAVQAATQIADLTGDDDEREDGARH